MLANLYRLGYSDAARAARSGIVQLQIPLDSADARNENVPVSSTEA